jgi:predicted transcriptional regulator
MTGRAKLKKVIPAKYRKITSAVEILMNRYVKGDPAKERFIEEELLRLDIAQQVYDLRREFNMTQADLAGAIGTTPSVISRLEDADYRGHSLTMLKRIAIALNKDLEVRFVDRKKKTR